MAYAKAEVAKGLIAFLASRDAKVEQLRKQIDAPDKNYAI